MAETRALRSVELTDPVALRAVAHPLRLALIALLRDEGPLTASQAAQRLGESAPKCWFHLRQLAKYGLVEEAGGGHGRERPWRATAEATSWPRVAATPQLAVASEQLMTFLAERYFEALVRWIAGKASEPEEWQEAMIFGDTALYLTAEELNELKEQLLALRDRYRDRMADPSTRPPGSRHVNFLHFAFPGSLVETAAPAPGRQPPAGGSG
jgi:predicted ArsR family transcriptional regulator